MITLISIIVTILFILACSKSLRKHPVPYYIGAAVVAVAVVVIQFTSASRYFPEFIASYVWPEFFRGGFTGALFIIVMWTGALPNGSAAMKKLMPIRGELSILASILGLGHSIANAEPYIRGLIRNPSRMSSVTMVFTWVSIAMVLVMLPLFITSFKSIRRKMKASSWKKLQRGAYIFYGLLFTHLSLLYIPYLIAGRDFWLTYIIYCLAFISYAICRSCKALLKKKGVNMKKVIAFGTGIAAVITALLCLMIASNTKESDRAKTAKAPVAAEISGDTNTSSSVLQVQEETAEQSNAPDQTETILAKIEDAQEKTEPLENESTRAEADVITAAEESSAEFAATEHAPAPHKYNDGTYYGTGDGYEGPITMSVTIENDLITWIDIIDQIEDPEFFTPALEVVADVLNNQHTDIDAVSGSTYSSYGILDAIDDALAQARVQ